MIASTPTTSTRIHEDLPDHLLSLLDPSTYPHPVNEISLIQTHISWVFLTGGYVYKIKKPVDFGFLDFTTLNKRKNACLDELRLNRRLAPDLYLDVLSIYICNDCYLIGKPDESADQIVDYALQMVQFDQQDLFSNRLMHGNFNPRWMDQLGKIIADFHLNADTNPHIKQYGSPEFLLRHMLENLDIAERNPPAGLSVSDLKILGAMSSEHMKQLEKRLSERQQSGYIRDCHGDLHLKNITLYNSQPTPFDCIEFSDEFRMIDTMNDVAFLVMDCDSIERSDLGYRFLSRYLERCGDYEGVDLLPIYLSYRAGVRGKVSSLLAQELMNNEASSSLEVESLHSQATHYFLMAKQYLSENQNPELIVVAGLSGSGKSHLALTALEHLKAIIIRSDATRKRIAKDHPELPMYGNEMHRRTYRAMFDAAATTLRAGIPVILDATFLHPASRESAAALAAELDVPLTFYWLDINNETLRERVQQRSRKGVDISDADLQVLEQQIGQHEQPSESYIIYIDSSRSWPPIKSSTAIG